MNASQYLYGLSVQGIQSYIFETDKLKEIVGASEIVASLAEDCVSEILGKPITDIEGCLVLQDAAGAFRCLVPESIARKLYCNMPRTIAEHVGDITCDQAVIPVDAPFSYEHIRQLEKALQAARNRPAPPVQLGQMATLKVPRTGKPAYRPKEAYLPNDERFDLNQARKRRFTHEPKSTLLPKLINDAEEWQYFTDDIEQITSDEYKNWVAVVHADGNGLGQKLLRLRNIGLTGDPAIRFFQKLSKQLDDATAMATKQAFQEVVAPQVEGDTDKIFPFRPVILGGDDLTVIIRGDLAVPFTSAFLQHFETQMQAALPPLDEEFNLKGLFADGLSACAGIAFIKSHYPFHYGVDLAGYLTSAAKEVSKAIDRERAPSSLLFHRVHGSFVRSWKEIKAKELSSPDGSFSLVGGPYFIKTLVQDDRPYPTVNRLMNRAKTLNREDAPKGRIREWLGHLLEDPQRAKDDLNRIIRLTDDKIVSALGLSQAEQDLKTDSLTNTHLYDALTLIEVRTV